jgi:hypothetical protein
MPYGLLADLVVALHVGYVGYVILGELIILLGVLCRWQWVRNPWFRLTHFLAIGIVAFEAMFSIDCPLTIWEDKLRVLAGQNVTEGTFIGRFFHDLLFYEGPQWIFNACYIAFALLVLLTLVLAPPRWRRRSQATPAVA